VLVDRKGGERADTGHTRIVHATTRCGAIRSAPQVSANPNSSDAVGVPVRTACVLTGRSRATHYRLQPTEAGPAGTHPAGRAEGTNPGI